MRCVRKEGDVIYRCCRECKYVKGSAEEVRAKRDADITGLLARANGEPYAPVYWTIADFEQLLETYRYQPAFLVKLRCIPFYDSSIERVKAYADKGRARYNKEYYDKIGREGKRQYYLEKKKRVAEQIANIDQLLKEKKDE